MIGTTVTRADALAAVDLARATIYHKSGDPIRAFTPRRELALGSRGDELSDTFGGYHLISRESGRWGGFRDHDFPLFRRTFYL